MVNSSGGWVAQYTYNAWGEIITSSGTMAKINPLRYRGYYYDTETGFYYLQSRYYDPVTHRFINADSYATTDAADPISCNMFAYCGNNPIAFFDPTGNIPSRYFTLYDKGSDILSNVLIKLKNIARDAEITEQMISVNFTAYHDTFVTASRFMSPGVIGEILSEILCDRYAEIYGYEFLFSDECVALEIEKHLEGYLYMIGEGGKRNLITNIGIFWKGEEGAYRSLCSAEIATFQVLRWDQALMFNYFEGIRDIYQGTEKDPWAPRRWPAL